MFDAGGLVRRATLAALARIDPARLRPWLTTGQDAIVVLGTAPGAWRARARVTATDLDRLLAGLSRDGRRFVSLAEVAAGTGRLSGGGRPLALVSATPDPGFIDQLVPVIARHGAPLAVFVAPDAVEGDRFDVAELLASVLSARSRLAFGTIDGMVELDATTPSARRRAFRTAMTWLGHDLPAGEVQGALRRLAHEAGIDLEDWRRQRVAGWSAIAGLAGREQVTIGLDLDPTLAGLPVTALPEAVKAAVDALALNVGHRPAAAFAGAPLAPAARAALLDAGITMAIGGRRGLMQGEEDALDLPCVRLDRVTAPPRALRSIVDGFPTSFPSDRLF